MEAAKVVTGSVAGRPLQQPVAEVDYSTFLRLLIAQLRNQDPTNPLKSSEYIGQLATFSQVEKTVQMSDRIAELLIASQFEQAEGLIGRGLVSADGRSGIVVSAEIVSGSLVATLDSGELITVEPGVVVSKSAS